MTFYILYFLVSMAALEDQEEKDEPQQRNVALFDKLTPLGGPKSPTYLG